MNDTISVEFDIGHCKMRKKNTFFQFKQFKIDQGQTAMKVTTEGCIFGAWVARQAISSERILDIGTGTGLLSLMLAQELAEAEIHAVEINEEAANQARQNFKESSWNGRLSIHQQTIQEFQNEGKFDLIISNPPFFKQSLNSPKANVNLARHDDSLSQQDLIDAIKLNLSQEGRAYILYPEREANSFRQLAIEEGMFPVEELTVFNSPDSKIFRTIMAYTKQDSSLEKSDLVIKDTEGNYTRDFVELLKEYYLHL